MSTAERNQKERKLHSISIPSFDCIHKKVARELCNNVSWCLWQQHWNTKCHYFPYLFFPPTTPQIKPCPLSTPPPPSCSTTWKGFWRCIPWKLAPFPLSSFITPWTGRTVSTSSSSSRLAQESSTKLFQSNYYQKHKAVSAAKRNYRRLIPIPLQSFATSLLSEPERGSLTSWRLLNWISCGFCSFVFNRILATELTEHLS